MTLAILEIRDLPAVNAGLNLTATILLLAGFACIRKGRVKAHRRFMMAAFCASTLFLASYLVYHFSVPTTPFQGPPALRPLYLAVLASHVVLAAAVPPLALVTLYRGLRGHIPRHRRIARITLPIWLYVSVTGVLIYLALYAVFPGRAAD